jgi:hypothetical protein
MAARSTPEAGAAGLTVPERLLLFRIASTPISASITHATAQQMMVRSLIERQAASRFALTDRGRTGFITRPFATRTL